tara:strand:- start:6218 stop:10294 length:4077 start_codon:yes stop_codon:yes gene_type:complete
MQQIKELQDFDDRRKAYLSDRDPYGIVDMTTGEAIKYAAEMGASDSLRGINQLISQSFNREEELERLRQDDKKLRLIMTHPDFGTEASTAFFAAAIGADPISYIPFAGWLKKGKSAKDFADFAKYGFTAGAAVSFLGYTPEDYALFVDDDASFVTKKFEQTTVGGTVGGVLSSAGAKVADVYMKARHGKSIFQGNTPTFVVDDANSPNKPAIINEGGFKEGQTVFLQDRKNQGVITRIDETKNIAEVRISNAKTGKSVRKEFFINELTGLKPTKKKGSKALIDSFIVSKGKGRQGRIYTIHDSIRSRIHKGFQKDISYQITKTKDGFTVSRNTVEKGIDPDLPSQPFRTSEKLQTFKTLREAKNFAVKEISPNAKGKPKMTRAKLNERIVDAAQNVNKKDENSARLSLSNIWKSIGGDSLGDLMWNRILKSPVEFGGAGIGAATGLTMTEYEDSMTEYFGKILGGALLGGTGVAGLKKLDSKYANNKFADLFGFELVADYGLPTAYKAGKQEFYKTKNQITLDFYDLLKRAEKDLSKEENRLLYIMMSGDPEDFSKLSDEVIQLGDDARKLLKKYGQELVDLGLLNEKTFLKNIETYMHRVYRNKDAEFRSKVTLGRDIKTIANNLKPRGLPPKEVQPRMFKKKWKNEGWYIDEKLPNGKYRIRRDYTKQERLDLGEMEDFSLSLVETGKLLSNDIAATKFFNLISKQFSIGAANFKAGKLPDGTEIDKSMWKQIPDVNIRGTNVKKYGDLSGRYVDKYVYNDVVHTFQLVKGADPGIGKMALDTYDTALGIWKKTKTAWNPATHVANTVSNIILINFAGTGQHMLGPALKSYLKRDKNFEDNFLYGGFGADLLSNDITKFATDNSDYFTKRINQMSDAKNPIVTVADMVKAGWNSKANVLKFTAQQMENLYQFEDRIFRHAVYLDRINKGFSKSEAAADARKWFIDYDINAPFIQKLKRTALPFVSYTYRVAPLLVEGAVRRPSAVALWAAVGYAINNWGVGATDDEVGEKLDRLTMRENDKRTLWNIPGMPPSIIRLPYNSENGDAMYVDVTRWLPGGDIFQQKREGKGLSVDFLPQPLQPGGPLVDFTYTLLTKEDPFTGDEIDENAEFFGINAPVLVHFFSHQLPNIPGMPGSYATERMNKVMKQNPPDPGTIAADYIAPILGFHTKESLAEQGAGYENFKPSPYAVPYSFSEAMAYTLGIKLKPLDSSKSFLQQKFGLDKEAAEIQSDIEELHKDYQYGYLGPKDYERKLRVLEENQLEHAARYNKLVNTYYALQLQIPYDEGQKINREVAEEIASKVKLNLEDTEEERIKKFDGGGVDVPYTKDAPRDRVDKFTGQPYSEQMENLGFNNVRN